MFKKFMSIFSISMLSFFAVQAAETVMRPVECAPQLRKYLTTIQKLSEARQLIADIQREGPIRIKLNDHHLSEKFGAFWDMYNRNICISDSSKNSEGDVISSIIFELHNAQANSKIEYYDNLAIKRKISRENYVQAIERIEFENSKKASAIVEKGIKLGIFPVTARLNTYRNFEEHYHYQKIGGHSAWIGKSYDEYIR
jgi:hypothetical protein